jgi:hypothetical protein
MGLIDVINWRDAASAACDCWAGVLGDQAVNAVGQNQGLTARNQAHGELTSSNQSLDHTRGAPRRRAIPARAYAPLFPGFSGVFMENITDSYNVT